MEMNSSRGLTLVEVLIVVGIIIILVNIAVNNIKRTRINANEANAVVNLQKIALASESYASMYSTFPANIAALSSENPPFIDSVLGSGTKKGYYYNLTGSTFAFTVVTRPVLFRSSGVRSFRIDETGNIRYDETDAPADITDPLLQAQ